MKTLTLKAILGQTDKLKKPKRLKFKVGRQFSNQNKRTKIFYRNIKHQKREVIRVVSGKIAPVTY